MSDSHSFSLPISEKEISGLVGRDIGSPVRISNLDCLGIDQAAFIETFSCFFEELPWDEYDTRRLRIEFLKIAFPQDWDRLDALLKPIYVGELDDNILWEWESQLNYNQQVAYDSIQPWRRRSVSQFLIRKVDETWEITREPVEQFVQGVDEDDYRSWPRVFAEAPAEHVENDMFSDWLKGIYGITKEVRPEMDAIRVVSHFMSVKATMLAPGDNSPEGAHEDGADYIVSALVINRKNVTGGESQIIEKREDGTKENIFAYTLMPGEFIFQGDSKDEVVHGTDLWHHVTPFKLDMPKLGEGWRDIIGLDINIVQNPQNI